MKLLFNYLIFPGFLFSACAGLMAGWVDRKVSARIQWRVGPPWHQNFTDLFKLLGKETILPRAARLTFILSPCFGLLSSSLVATILGRNIISSSGGFNADLIVVLYLLVIPAIAVILGAFSSANPLASVGASREMKMVLAYELPFIISMVAIIIKCKGAIQLGEILEYQRNFGSNLISLSGALAFFVSIFCIQAKLGLAPFDASEAEQEIMSGVLIEYSGSLLALFKLTKAILLYSAPVLLVVLFMGKDLSPLFIILKYTAILVALVLIKNTNPRLRIDQALRFFWRVPTILALLAVVSAVFGL